MLPDEAAERSRATMWDVVRFTEFHQYRAIVVENVVDAAKWVLFSLWLHAMDALGYDHHVVYQAISVAEPMPTRTTTETDALLVPVEGRDGKQAQPAVLPMRMMTTRSETGVLVPYYGNGTADSTDDPHGTMPTRGRWAMMVPLRNHNIAKWWPRRSGRRWADHGSVDVVSLTEDPVRARTKTVARRMRWLMLRSGDRLTLCRKVMGRRRGEPLMRIADVEVVSVRREPLDAIGPEDVLAEGFPDLTAAEFVEFFCATHNGCRPETEVTRIQWRYLE
ncbi:hypothetical protein [Nocardia sp. NPDC050710]|uniref:hypothetical protein n=1 Tax=Nocardia sp. NPDC050710 TaxID=3157220 RepID=UPI0033C4B069